MSNELPVDTETYDMAQALPVDFEAHLNTEFDVDLRYLGIDINGNATMQEGVYPDVECFKLKLVEVTRYQPVSKHLRQEPFSIVFCGSHDLPLYSSQHMLHHPVLGRVCLFLSPINFEPGIMPERHPLGRFYETVVN